MESHKFTSQIILSLELLNYTLSQKTRFNNHSVFLQIRKDLSPKNLNTINNLCEKYNYTMFISPCSDLKGFDFQFTYCPGTSEKIFFNLDS